MNVRSFRVARLGLAIAAIGLAARTGTGQVVVIPPGNPPAAAETAAPAASTPQVPAFALAVTPPVGAVVAWVKSQANTPPLPPEWVECNGQTLNMPGSPYDKQPIPDLNGASGQPRRFLRGAPDSGATGGSETHTHSPSLVNRDPPRNFNVSDRAPANHLPPYFEVTWIMRVR